MDAGQGFVDTLPIYTIMPNASPQYVVGIKLSSELLQHLQSKGTAGMTISFGSQNIISVGNEQFSFRAPPEEHGVTDCYHQVDEGEEGTFTKVGVVKRKIFVTQKLREEDRKRVKTATETHEKERLSHKSVLIDSTGQLISKDGKRKAPSSITKPPPTVIKRNRTETTQPRPQLASLSSMASKHATAASSKLSSPKRVPLRTQIVQLLALEALPHEQIEAKCSTASKTALASTLQQARPTSSTTQVAKMKDGLYHLKKEMYREVDTNWPSFTPEDKAKVLERKALAKQPEQEKKKEEEAAEDIPAPEPIALEAKATGTRYPSPLPRSLAAAGKERAKPEEKVIPARLAPPPSSLSSSSSAKMEKERELARERERAKEKEREKELARERERAKEEERERERERVKEREKERERLLREKHERSPKDPSPAHSSASSSASSSPSGSPAALVVPGSSPNKAKEEASAPRNGENKRKKARTEPPREGTTSLSLPGRDGNGAWKGPSISLSEYKKRRAEWEKNYKEYCELHRKLNENAQFFQNLGGQLKKASSSEKTKIVHQISTDYQKRISRVRQMKLRFSFLHGEIKREKAALLALNPS